MKMFSKKSPAETVPLAFDFTADLGVETINGTPTISVALWGAVPDPTPNAIISGGVALVGGVAQQKVTGGVLGADYYLTCVAVTSGGRTLALGGILPVRNA